jgi:AraC-like DNA-binding protein
MTTFRPTVLTRVPLLILEQAKLLGLDRAALMKKADLTPQELKDPDGRVPSLKIWWLWQELIRQVPDPALGIKMGETPHSPTRYGLVGYTLVFSRTLGEALARLSRYSRIIAETVQLTIESDGWRFKITLQADPQFELLRHPIDSRLASILSSLRHLSGKSLNPLGVDFPYPRLRDASVHRRYFQAPLHFRAPRAALHFSREDMDLPIVHSDDTLARYLDRLATQQMKTLGVGSLTERVGRTIWFELNGGMPPLKRIAAKLGVSPRSLQRSLRKEGKPYRGLLDEFRREMAVRLMSQRNLSVHEIAFLLGYNEPSSFHKAFRRWYRTSPRTFRRAS